MHQHRIRQRLDEILELPVVDDFSNSTSRAYDFVASTNNDSLQNTKTSS
jgi:cell fate (sporulation/competence/biofilm development) regulator YmcA (YheA/YmcA/DUF963 family)